MANDKYLDSSQVIRDLCNAEQARNLDSIGVIDKLQAAIRHCAEMGRTAEEMVESYTKVSDAYSLAMGYYLAEVQARVEAAGITFTRWHRNSGSTLGVGISLTVALRLIRAVRTANPLRELGRYRAEAIIRNQRSDREEKIRAMADPLHRVKREWGKLSRSQQGDFLFWAKVQFNRNGVSPVTMPLYGPDPVIRQRRSPPYAPRGCSEAKRAQLANARAAKALKRRNALG